MEADGRLPWPEWSHTPTECCCASHVRAPVGAGVKSSCVVCHHWHWWCLTVSPFYQVLWKNNFMWGPEQQQAFGQIKQGTSPCCGPQASMDRTGCKEHPLNCCWRKVPLGFSGKGPQERPEADPWDSGVEHTGALKRATLQMESRS